MIDLVVELSDIRRQSMTSSDELFDNQSSEQQLSDRENIQEQSETD